MCRFKFAVLKDGDLLHFRYRRILTKPKINNKYSHSESRGCCLLGLDSDTFYIYHVAAVMVDNLRRLLLGINLSDKAVMDFDFPGVGFPV